MNIYNNGDSGELVHHISIYSLFSRVVRRTNTVEVIKPRLRLHALFQARAGTWVEPLTFVFTLQ